MLLLLLQWIAEYIQQKKEKKLMGRMKSSDNSLTWSNPSKIKQKITKLYSIFTIIHSLLSFFWIFLGHLLYEQLVTIVRRRKRKKWYRNKLMTISIHPTYPSIFRLYFFSLYFIISLRISRKIRREINSLTLYQLKSLIFSCNPIQENATKKLETITTQIIKF